MGTAFAEDTNQTTQDTLQATDNNVLTDTPEGSYSDLENNLTGNSIKLENNYKYNNQTDSGKEYLKLNNVTCTIDGNGKIIDGDKKAGLFRITNNSDVTIKNLIIRNCLNTSVILINSKLTTFNVTFEDNYDVYSGAAVYTSASNYISNEDKFLNNDAKYGSSIFAEESNINIEKALFSSNNPVQWALIYGDKSNININNSIFANTTSRYATAIYNTYRTFINKSKFTNLYANITSGAIAIKTSSLNATTSIIDCEFVNVSSAKNGGALFLDMYGNSDGKLTGWVLINNTLFNNCSSEFGGAILQLGGFLDIYNSQFINNEAKENGGAVYTSNAVLFADNCNFTENRAHETDGLGGAIFFDYSILTVGNSNFKDNVAGEGGAIYIYDSQYSLTDSQFANNGEDIRSYFDKPNSVISNCGDNINSKINNTKSEFNIRFGGEPIILNPTVVDAKATDSYFNLKDWGLVTPVKNQGSMGSCWAFGAAGAFESAFLKATNITLDISENNIQNMGLFYSLYGNSELSEAGTYYTSAAYFLSWLGAINSPDDVYDELGKISSLSFSPNAYHVVDAIFINVSDKNAIKEALIKYGALNLFVCGADSADQSYNNVYKSVYNANKTGNHYVTLVGWNDTFSKDHFTKTPPGDGAWICKNSWGTDWGDNGYFYLSYYDNSLKESDVVGFVIENTENYEKLYQVEVGGFDGYNTKFTEYEDVFVSNGGDIISAVGSFFEKAGTAYTISIYVSDNLVYTQSGKVNRSGYNTIKLNKCIAVEDGSVFSVRIKSASTPILSQTRQHLWTNNSYVIVNNQALYLSDSVAPIKVYTYHASITTKNIVKCYDKNSVMFTVEDGVSNDIVLISFNGANMTINLDDNGTGSISLGVLNIGEYDVTVFYKDKTFTNHISVKKSIDFGDEDSYTFAYNTKITLEGQFLDSNAKPLNKIEIPVKFDGENIKGLVCEENGVLNIVVFPGNSIGKHILEITNPQTGESQTITINIVSRFAENADLNMYYYDGHTFKVRVKDHLGKFVGKNEVVTIKIGKKTFNVKTDAKGYAVLKIPNTILPGKYTITATYFGQTVKNNLKVKQVVKLSKVKVKKSARKLILKATLKQGSKALKSKKVTFKFNGKKYNAKTDKKGVAKVTIKKSALKKLKVGKKVKYQVTYLKNTVKTSVKVKK